MEKAIIERVKNQVRNLKALSEELEVQMALGKLEAKDLIEKEGKVLSSYIEEQRKILNTSDTTTTENRRTFLTAVENLQSALNQAIPSKSKAYDSYKTNILNNIYKLEEVVKENYPNSSNDMQTRLDSFKAKMDAFRVNLALHDKDDPAKVEQIRNDFAKKLDEVKTVLAKNENDQSKLDSFLEDITESFNYFKRAISDLSD